MQWLLKDDLSLDELKDQTLNLPSQSNPAYLPKATTHWSPCTWTPCSLHYSYGLVCQRLVRTGSSTRGPFPLHLLNAWTLLILHGMIQPPTSADFGPLSNLNITFPTSDSLLWHRGRAWYEQHFLKWGQQNRHQPQERFLESRVPWTNTFG